MLYGAPAVSYQERAPVQVGDKWETRIPLRYASYY